jgi:hypothetical protein
MTQLTPGAEALSQRIEAAFTRFEKRVHEAEKPKTEWNRFNPVEQKRLLEEQRQAAVQTNERELEIVKNDLDALLIKLREDVEKKLRPLQTSNVQNDRLEGQNYEEKAQRLARLLTSTGIGDEYNRAMGLKQFDLATELVHWAELYADPKDMPEQEFVRKLKEIHEAATGVAELKRSQELLQSRFEQLQRGNPFSKSAFNITEQVMLLKNDADFAAELKDAAEKIQSEQG